jgi:ribosome biogenesis GTPase
MGKKAKSGGRLAGRGRGRAGAGDERGEKDGVDREAQLELQRQRLLARFEGTEPDGLVVCQFGSHAETVFTDNSSLMCMLTPKVHKLFGVCAGDRVWTERGASDQERLIVGRAVRRNELRRRRGEEDRTGHVIAANVDLMAITTALLEPPLRTGALDRYLVLASALGIEAMVVLTKLDQTPEDDPGWQVLQPYRELGVKIVATSATSGRGLDELRSELVGRVSVFAGHSGVGKSSLCQALGLEGAPEAGEMSRTGGRIRGRHKTSVARLLPLPRGGWVVDTPGVRAIGLVDLSRADAPVHFPEFAKYSRDCGYRDCLHLTEEGCAVRVAVDAEEIPASRYGSYQRLMASLEEG